MNPAYLEDASGFRGHADALHFPADEAELIGILLRASHQKIPMTVAGAGTGVTGGRVPLGGEVISLEKFRRCTIDEGRATVGAGLLLRELQDAASRTGQFYAPDPTEWTAAIGGTIANNASGSRSFRYGDTRRHVFGLRVAFVDGAVRHFRRGEAIDFDVPSIPRPGTTKHSAGYLLQPGMDWLDLLIGSEGTLGIVTEAELRLLPAPGELITGVVFFLSDDAALDAVDAWRTVDRLRMLEYLDAPSLALLRGRYSDIPSSARACLLIEQETASEADWDSWADRVMNAGALEDSWFAATDRDRERFRQFRHALPEEVNSFVRQRGFQKMGSDYAVPIDRNREMMAIYRTALDREFSGQYAIFGHIGDAHVHVNILPRDAAEADRAKALMIEFAKEAVLLGGTVSAEHGLGKRKAHLLALQYKPAEIEAMKSVKRRLDPEWLLGRGNLFDFATP